MASAELLAADDLGTPTGEAISVEGPQLRAIVADDDTFARVMRWPDGEFEVEVYQVGKGHTLKWSTRKE